MTSKAENQPSETQHVVLDGLFNFLLSAAASVVF